MRPLPQPLSVTSEAADRVKALLAQRGTPAVGIRIGVRSKGCSGLSYTLECDVSPDFSIFPVEIGPFDATGTTETRSILFAPPFTPEDFIRVRRN